MAASKDILFWTPRGQLLRNKRIIPVTNIAELVEYVLLPHNNEVTKPRALNTFLDWLAELGIDKGLVKNKTLLNDLIEKEKGHRNAEITSENESNNEESSSGIENLEDREGSGFWEWQWSRRHPRERQRHLNVSEKTESNSHETSTTFHSENPCEHCENSNVYGKLIINVLIALGTIHKRFVLHVITRSPRREITWKTGLSSVPRLWSNNTQKREHVENHLLFPL